VELPFELVKIVTPSEDPEGYISLAGIVKSSKLRYKESTYAITSLSNLRLHLVSLDGVLHVDQILDLGNGKLVADSFYGKIVNLFFPESLTEKTESGFSIKLGKAQVYFYAVAEAQETLVHEGGLAILGKPAR
jgi:hypothetical protein